MSRMPCVWRRRLPACVLGVPAQETACVRVLGALAQEIACVRVLGVRPSRKPG